MSTLAAPGLKNKNFLAMSKALIEPVLIWSSNYLQVWLCTGFLVNKLHFDFLINNFALNLKDAAKILLPMAIQQFVERIQQFY